MNTPNESDSTGFLTINLNRNVSIIAIRQPIEYAERKKNASTSVFEAISNMLKGLIGTALFSLPIAMKNMGLFCGPMMLIAISLITMLTIRWLIDGINKMRWKQSDGDLQYSDAMRYALKDYGPTWLKPMANISPSFVNFFNLLNQFLILSSYILFMAWALKAIVDIHGRPFDVRLHILIIASILCACNIIIRDSKFIIGIFSIIGNVLTLFGIIISLAMFSHNNSFDVMDADLIKFGDFKSIIMGFGTLVFAYLSIGTFVSIEYNMKKPKCFTSICGVFNVCISIGTILYFLIGFMGYTKYGNAIEPSFILNFPRTSHWTTIVSAFFVIGIGTASFIQIYPIVETFLLAYQRKREATGKSIDNIVYIDIIIRIIIIIISSSVVVVFTDMFELIAFIGFLCDILLGITLPCLIKYCVCNAEEPNRWILKIISATIGILSFILMFIGVGVSLEILLIEL